MPLTQEIRDAARSLSRTPAFTLLAVVTLALGIGANTALFSVLKAVVLDPLPFPDPGRLMTLERLARDGRVVGQSAADFVDVARDARSFAAFAGSRERVLDLAGAGGEPVRLSGAEVTPAFFDVFGVPAALGRPLRASEDRPGDRRAVLSARAFRRVFGSDRSVVGRTLEMGGVSATVVGVMPDGFDWPAGAEAWLLSDLLVPSSPIPTKRSILENRGMRYIDAIARLRPGVGLAAARGEMIALDRRLVAADPANNADAALRLRPLHDQVTGAVRLPLVLLFGVVCLVLLAAATNVAGLLVARGAGRRRELAIRVSLGASPGSLARHLLAESLLLSLLGGAAGLLVADAAPRALLRVLPDAVPRGAGIGVDPGVLVFTLGVSVLTGLLFGVAPARAATRVDVVEGLRASGRGATSGSRLRSRLVAVQIAVAVGVVGAAGLLLRSLERISSVDAGFAVDSLVTIDLSIPDARYPAPAVFYRDVLAALRQRARYPVAAGFPAPFTGDTGAAPIRRVDQPVEAALAAHLVVVTPGYFGASGVPLVAGRDFAEADRSDAAPVLILSRAAAERLWPGQDAVGRTLAPFMGSTAPVVIGVVGDVRRQDLTEEPGPALYLPVSQFPLSILHVVARGAPASQVAADLRAVVRSIDPTLPLGDARTVVEARAGTLAAPRFRAALVASFAGLTLVLVAVGLYGVLSDSVSRRTRELAVRLALGARPGQVVGHVMRDALRVAVLGMGVGLVGALVLGRVLASLLFQIGPADPAALGATCLLVITVVGLAAFLPAWRAARIAPAEALAGD